MLEVVEGRKTFVGFIKITDAIRGRIATFHMMWPNPRGRPNHVISTGEEDATKDQDATSLM